MWCDAMRCDVMRCDTMQCDAMQCNVMQYDAMRCGKQLILTFLGTTLLLIFLAILHSLASSDAMKSNSFAFSFETGYNEMNNLAKLNEHTILTWH